MSSGDRAGVIDRLASVRPQVLGAGAAVVVLLGALLFGLWPMPQVQELGAGPVLDTRLLSAGRDAAGYVDAIGEEGRRLYTVMLVGDMLWTIVHGLTLAAGIAVGFTRSRRWDRLAWFAVVPLLAAVLDLAENSAFLAAIVRHPDAPPLPARLMDVLTTTKFVFVAAAYVLAAAALVAWWRAGRAQGPPG